MKTIRILEDCIHKGQHIPARTVLKNVPTDEAADLIVSGRAVEEKEPHTVRAAPKATVEHRDPAIESRDAESDPGDETTAKPAKKTRNRNKA